MTGGVGGHTGATPDPAGGPLIEVVPATADRWPDVENLLPRAGGYPCWCQAWRRTDREFTTANREVRRDALHTAVDASPSPGVLAYVGGEAVGWCGFGPRIAMVRLDELGVPRGANWTETWTISCFAIRPDHRRRDVALALLRGAIEYAQSAGATAVEAFPTAPGGPVIRPQDWYAGLPDVLEAAGFASTGSVVLDPARPPRAAMRLDLIAGSS